MPNNYSPPHPPVNTGGERCEACRVRPAVGASVAAHLLCAECLEWYEAMAVELAQEVHP